MNWRIFTVIFLMMLSTALFGQVQRKVLLEETTNTSCPDCAREDPALHQYIKHHYGTVIPIQFHGWWPGANDPLFLYAEQQNRDRIAYYNLNYVPIVFLDGELYGEPNDSDEMNKTVRQKAAMETNVGIEVNVIKDEGAGNVKIDVNLIAYDDISQTNLKLRVGIIEREIFYDVAPGIPGFDNFGNVMRKILPSSDGEPVTFGGKEDTLTFQYVEPIDSVWNLDEIYAVAWLQSDDTQEVLQAEVNYPTYRIVPDGSQYDFLEPNMSVMKRYTLTNNNENDLHVRLKPIVKKNSGNWIYKISYEGALYDSIDVAAPAGTTIEFRLSLTTSNAPGEFKADIFAMNLDDVHNYGNSESYYALVASGGVLFVDSDQGAQSEQRYLDILESLGLDYTLLQRDLLLPLLAEKDSLPFDAMIWSNGDKAPSFDTSDVKLMQNFLDKGGSLLMTGQQVGNDIFGDEGTSNFPEARDFYHNYLDADFIQDDSGIYTMVGVPGNPLGEGIQFTINTIYPRSPDAFRSFGGNGNELLVYTDSQMYGAITYANEKYHTALIGFSVEQMIPRSMATVLLGRIFASFDMITDVNYEENELPGKFILYQNYPNPFNPETVIKFNVPKESFVSLKLYDVLGDEIQTLVNEKKSAGLYQISFDGSGLSSGVYFYRLQAGKFSAAKKMILLR
ncbi:MAG: Omp28-related outer membrane protein [Chlorobi bacterium]|nr:Omp28-related outer membrane protein [Chlorobiota bacterium]